MSATTSQSLGGLFKKTYGKAKELRRKAQDMLGQKDGDSKTRLTGDVDGREYLANLKNKKGRC